MNTLVVGDFSETERERLARAAARAEVPAVFCPSVTKALPRMRAGHERPLCALVAGAADVRQFVDRVREDAELFALPVLVLLERPSGDGWRDAYLAGADDVVIAADVGGFTRRLANLRQHPSRERPAATLGAAAVVSDEEGSRRRIGRTLRQVGFDVCYAAGLDEIARMVERGERPAFAVAAGVFDDAGELRPREGLRNVVEVAGVPVLLLSAGQAARAQQTDDQIADVTGKLLFFADEQAKAAFKDRRASARKLYSSICSFRAAGALQPTYGVTHNLSGSGMYVRTLDPPRPGSALWVELQAPVSGMPIHLRAEAVWQRLPGSGKGVLPPGFGMRFDAERCPPCDLSALLEGYAALDA